jgi:hypothetical protein
MKGGKLVSQILFVLFFHSVVYSAPADTTSIIDNIYNYDFAKASERLSKLSAQDPLITEALNLEIKWWMSLERGNQNQFADFLNTLNRFEKASNNKFSEILFSTYRMRYYAISKKQYLIPFIFLKIQKQISRVDISQLKSSGIDSYELFTLYKSFLDLLQNSFLSDLFLPDTLHKQKLIDDIKFIAANGSSPNRTIATYFLMKYYLDVEKDKPKAFSYLSTLHKQYPNNLIFTQLLTN